MTKYQWLHQTLGKLGHGIITVEQFWSEMRKRNLTDRDIDAFLETMREREGNSSG
jgi:hypothetical protein